MFEVNCFGTIMMTKYFYPFIAESKGNVIITGSATAIVPIGYKGLYETTKGALRVYAEGLRQELKRKGVGVTLIEPGGILTTLSATMFAEAPRNSFLGDEFSRFRSTVVSNLNMQLRPADVAPIYYENLFTKPPKRRIYIATLPETILWNLLLILPTRIADLLIRVIFFS